MNVKYHYDKNHQSLFMKFDEYAYIRFHKNYDISIMTILDFKYNQQYVDSFKILKKIDQLTYHLKLFEH